MAAQKKIRRQAFGLPPYLKKRENPLNSAVPFVDQRFDLIGKFGQILVGAAPVAFDNFQKLLPHGPQPLVDGRFLAGGRFFLFDPRNARLYQRVGRQVVYFGVIRRMGGKSRLPKRLAKRRCDRFLAMDQKYMLRSGGIGVDPAQKRGAVCVGG